MQWCFKYILIIFDKVIFAEMSNPKQFFDKQLTFRNLYSRGFDSNPQKK